MTEAWLIPPGHDPNDVTTPSAIQLRAVEGTRVLKLEDRTLYVVSTYPDGTAYVTAKKEFPQAVIDAARRKWGQVKQQAPPNQYYSDPLSGQWGGQQQASNPFSSGFGGANAQQGSMDDFQKYMEDMMNASIFRRRK